MECCCSSLTDLRRKEVINISTGTRLGNVCDLELDLKCGRITALIGPEHQPIFSFKRAEEYRIPWECINKIGDDIILVSSAHPLCRDRTDT